MFISTFLVSVRVTLLGNRVKNVINRKLASTDGFRTYKNLYFDMLHAMCHQKEFSCPLIAGGTCRYPTWTMSSGHT